MLKLDDLKDFFEGDFIGEVVDNSDPENLFRVKVKIDNLTDKIPTELLPWYLVRQPIENTYNTQGNVPNVGSKVWVRFPYKDIYNGIVVGEITWHPPEM